MQLQTETAPDVHRLYVIACCRFGPGVYHQGGWPLAMEAMTKATAGYNIQTAADPVNDVIKLMFGCVRQYRNTTSSSATWC